jgi:hypothetical protein
MSRQDISAESHHNLNNMTLYVENLIEFVQSQLHLTYFILLTKLHIYQTSLWKY